MDDVKKRKRIVYLIFIIAFCLRLAYILVTPYDARQHDLTINNKYGGLDYINTIYNTGMLPQSNGGQLFHPPLFYMSAVLWMRIISFFTTNQIFMFESLQWLTLIYSMLLIFVFCKILQKISIKDKYKNLILLFMAINPTLIILSGSINNDMLSTLLIFWTILRLIKWYENSTANNTLFLAVVTGLNIMTKMSGTICVLPIIFVVLKKLYEDLNKENDKENKKKIIKKYSYMTLLFLSVSLPIGLWYPIRNLIVFDQPILYIWDTKNPTIYIGEYNTIERYLSISIEEINRIYVALSLKEHNVIAILVKSALFGEYQYANSGILYFFARYAVFANLISMFAFVILSLVRVFNIKKYNKNTVDLIFVMIFFLNIISLYMLNIKLPYGCSTDFRFMIPALFASLFLSFSLINDNEDNKIIKNIFELIITLTIISYIFANIVILFTKI